MEVAEENFKGFLQAAEYVVEELARDIPELSKALKEWVNEHEKDVGKSLAEQEQRLMKDINLDSRIIDIHLQKAELNGSLTPDQVLDVKMRLAELQSTDGIGELRRAAFEINQIRRQFDVADRAVKQGVPVNNAYANADKFVDLAQTRTMQVFGSIERRIEQMRDRAMKNIAQRAR